MEGPSIINTIIMSVAERGGELLSQMNIYENNFSLSSYKCKFTKLKSKLDKVNYVDNDMSTYELHLKFSGDGKHDMRGIVHRKCGDKEFAAGDIRSALDDYTCSIGAAQSTEVLAVGYANRSATLYKLGLYRECIEDIDRAIENHYPQEKKDKLLVRQEQARRSDCNKFWHEPIPQIPESQINPLFPCATDSIKIKKNKEFGRHVVAVKDIEIGEIISVESPNYVSVVTSERLNHCYECLKLCYNPLPCTTCTTALFCSHECLHKSLNGHHKYLCPIIMTLLENAIEPLEVVLIAIMTALDCKDGHNRYGCNGGNSFSNARLNYSFLTSVLVCDIFKLLKDHTTFFEDNEGFEDGFKEAFLTHLEAVPRMGTKITELKKKGNIYENIDIGFGVYSFFSLFNHSCTPNVTVTFYGNTVVTRAINTIKAGSQCFVAYNGVSYDKHSKPFRQAYLTAGYFFSCKCRACTEGWKARHDCAESLSSLDSEDYNALFTSIDVNLAKKLLPQCIANLKRCELLEPKGTASTLKGIIQRCYRILGNHNYW